MQCRECGESILDDDKFCEHCGSPVGKGPKVRSKPRIYNDDPVPTPVPTPTPTPRPRPRYDDDSDRKERSRRRDRDDYDDDDDDDDYHRRSDDRDRPRSEGKRDNRCPDCGDDLKYIEQYRSYWCDRCQKYASSGSGPPSHGHGHGQGYGQGYPHSQGQPPQYGPPPGAYPQRKFSIVFLIFQILAFLTMIGAIITSFEDLYILSAILWLFTALFFGIAGVAQYLFRKKQQQQFAPQPQYQGPPPGNY